MARAKVRMVVGGWHARQSGGAGGGCAGNQAGVMCKCKGKAGRMCTGINQGLLAVHVDWQHHHNTQT